MLLIRCSQHLNDLTVNQLEGHTRILLGDTILAALEFLACLLGPPFLKLALLVVQATSRVKRVLAKIIMSDGGSASDESCSQSTRVQRPCRTSRRRDTLAWKKRQQIVNNHTGRPPFGQALTSAARRTVAAGYPQGRRFHFQADCSTH